MSFFSHLPVSLLSINLSSMWDKFKQICPFCLKGVLTKQESYVSPFGIYRPLNIGLNYLSICKWVENIYCIHSIPQRLGRNSAHFVAGKKGMVKQKVLLRRIPRRTKHLEHKNYSVTRRVIYMPDHSRAILSNFASQQVPWQSGEKGRFGNLNPQTK